MKFTMLMSALCFVLSTEATFAAGAREFLQGQQVQQINIKYLNKGLGVQSQTLTFLLKGKSIKAPLFLGMGEQIKQENKSCEIHRDYTGGRLTAMQGATVRNAQLFSDPASGVLYVQAPGRSAVLTQLHRDTFFIVGNTLSPNGKKVSLKLHLSDYSVDSEVETIVGELGGENVIMNALGHCQSLLK